MRRNRNSGRRFRTLPASACLAVAVLLANSPAQAEEAGRFCTEATCAGAPSEPWTAAIGFGVVALATGWIARRRGFSER